MSGGHSASKKAKNTHVYLIKQLANFPCPQNRHKF